MNMWRYAFRSMMLWAFLGLGLSYQSMSSGLQASSLVSSNTSAFPTLINPYPSQPPSTGSLYVDNPNDINADFSYGYNHGRYANAVGGWGGMVILDFGCQVGYQDTLTVTNKNYADASSISQTAISYAEGFNDAASGVPLVLVIGTNNSCTTTYSYGQGWEQLVSSIGQQIHAFDSAIQVYGGSDLE